MTRDGVTQRVVEKDGQLVLLLALHGAPTRALLLKRVGNNFVDEDGNSHPLSIREKPSAA